jgi:hypothetical protein
MQVVEEKPAIGLSEEPTSYVPIEVEDEELEYARINGDDVVIEKMDIPGNTCPTIDAAILYMEEVRKHNERLREAVRKYHRQSKSLAKKIEYLLKENTYLRSKDAKSAAWILVDRSMLGEIITCTVEIVKRSVFRKTLSPETFIWVSDFLDEYHARQRELRRSALAKLTAEERTLLRLDTNLDSEDFDRDIQPEPERACNEEDS